MPGIRGAFVPILLALGYALLLTGGKLPTTAWQLVVFASQSLLLTFMTCYVGRLSLGLYQQNENATSQGQVTDRVLQALSDGLQQLPCAVLLVSADDHKLLYANHAAFHLFDVAWLPDSQLTQRRLNELFRFTEIDGVHGDGAQHPVIRAICQRERVVVNNLSIERLDGEHKQVSITAIPLFDANNECVAAMAQIEDMTAHNQQLRRIEDIAYRDPLTGLLNRLSILQRIQESFDRQDASPFALLFMDFDRFKLINDSLGHEVGDQLLIEIGNRIRNSTRASDCTSVPARLGGDEFVVLLDNLPDTTVAPQIAERLLQALNEPYHLAGHAVVSTASIGVVTSSHRPASASDMLRNADLAMYKSKMSGKARCSLFDDSLRRQVEQRLQLESELRSAVKYDEFDLDVQPILDLFSRTNVGGEALLRWQHPRLGRISANQFVDVACETGLIVPIGDQLLRRACNMAASISTMEGAWRLHVNISRLQLLLPPLLEVLDATLQESGLEPDSLVLEVAESSVKDEPEKVAERFRELKERGIKICLDNFGSGASPLVLLKKLPLDYLKLDRSLVHAVESPDSCVLLEALSTIANSYGISVIAEGIENERQLNRLCELGCHYGQGYVFRRPVQASEFRIEPLPEAVG